MGRFIRRLGRTDGFTLIELTAVLAVASALLLVVL